MFRRADRSGQSLVETALVLPLVMLIIVWIAHFIILVRVKMDLGMSAAHIADVIALGQNSGLAITEEAFRLRGYLRWGYPLPVQTQVKVFTPYRSWTKFATLKEPGRMASAEMKFRFISRVVSRWYALGGLPLQAHVEFPLEPSFPGEGS